MAHKLVVVARQDLKLSKGKLAAQVGHASVDCALRAMKSAKKDFLTWKDEGQKKAVVKAPDERTLHDLQADAKQAGLVTALIRDAGHTEIPAGTITVLGIGPADEDAVDRITGHLTLL